MPSVIMLCVTIKYFMLNVVSLSVIMMNVIMLNVVAPFKLQLASLSNKGRGFLN